MYDEIFVMIDVGRPVKDIQIDSNTSIEKIFQELSQSGGFESVNLSDGLEILTEMIPDDQCLKFISFVGAIVSTGIISVKISKPSDKFTDSNPPDWDNS